MSVRTRFAPSPTGALHIGGIRTALYAYLFAKQNKGTFVLRIEDTDQGRFVEGAEAYIIEALHWCGLTPDEGPRAGGAYGPYRQSERRAIYQRHARQLIDNGWAYYAFDTPAALSAARSAAEAQKQTFRYDSSVRNELDNSLNLSADELQVRLDRGEPYTIRLKVPEDELVQIQDRVRGNVQFQSNELDDKVMLKADGMPTYHLANVVDDRLMQITHVIRGEEWLPSTAHHVLLYRAFGWEQEMPEFAHLPLILKPNGKGKLSKRDGAKFGFPVFPLDWQGATVEDSFEGFRGAGYDPAALVNFLAFLGWNPGTEQELFSLEELVEAFSLDNISKGGARFDIDKAKWFNQQYLMQTDDTELARQLRPYLATDGLEADGEAFLTRYAGLFKERAHTLRELAEAGDYLFGPVRSYEEKMIRKKWKPEHRPAFEALADRIATVQPFEAARIQEAVKAFAAERELGMGAIFPMLRLGTSGTMQGPGVFDIIELLGPAETRVRLRDAYAHFDRVKAGS